MRDESKLLPCPFCGGEACMSVRSYPLGNVYRVECGNVLCRAGGPKSDAEWDAAQKWNHRSRPTCRLVPDDTLDHVWYCSACGEEAADDWDSMADMGYCPSCGARVVDVDGE